MPTKPLRTFHHGGTEDTEGNQKLGGKHVIAFVHRSCSKYEKGMGGSKDLVSAYMWYDVAVPLLPSDKIRQEVVRIRDEMAKEMTPAQINKAKKLSGEWLKKFDKK